VRGFKVELAPADEWIMTSTHSPAPPKTSPSPPPFRVIARETGTGAARLVRGAVWLLPAVLVVCAGFRRRWMSDDAFIYVRTVRQVLAGNGPVFNPGERVESSTGTLWQWLLVAAGAVGADPASAAVYAGLVLTGAGFALAGLGALRLYGGRAVVPLGSLMLLGLPPVWDFATSGLETGLVTCWIAGAWLALIARPGSLVTSALIGLGPLVRPDLGLVSVVFLGAQWLLARPSWRGVLAGAGAAGALPGAYEVFRAGYYGHLVPLPAVTKEASRSLWGRGFGYFGDLALPYLLWVPALFVVVAVVSGRGELRRAAVPVLAPVVAGLLCWMYVVKVGGDFMHGRMLLPGLLLLVLPVFVVPLSRAGVCAAVGVGVWAVVCAGWLRVPYAGHVGPAGIADERGVYVRHNADPHPVHHDFAGAPYHRRYLNDVREAVRSGVPTLLFDGRGPRTAANSPSVTASYVVLGLNGSVVPLDGAALDPIGLAYPLAAHSERIEGGRVAHDKWLPAAWLAADRGLPADPPPGTDPAQIDAARRALRCGALADLRAATRDPLTPGRFLRNLAGAWQRTAFRFPNDPVRAERALCGR
jgi:arabinofuranosyltransferase